MAGPARLVMQAVAGRATLARERRIPNSGRVLMPLLLSAIQVGFQCITTLVIPGSLQGGAARKLVEKDMLVRRYSSSKGEPLWRPGHSEPHGHTPAPMLQCRRASTQKERMGSSGARSENWRSAGPLPDGRRK